MNRRRPLVAAALVAVAVALAACGSDADDRTDAGHQPVRPVAPVSLTPSQVYYELTHPEPASSLDDGPPAGLRSPEITPFDVYYDATHP
jgi:hypothetical protein